MEMFMTNKEFHAICKFVNEVERLSDSEIEVTVQTIADSKEEIIAFEVFFDGKLDFMPTISKTFSFKEIVEDVDKVTKILNLLWDDINEA